MRNLLLCCLAALPLLSCASPSRREAPPPRSTHLYRLIVELPAGQDLPFFLEIPGEVSDGAAYALNGEERTPAEFTRVRVENGERVTLRFQEAESELALRIGDNGDARGVWRRPEREALAVEGHWAQWTPDLELRRFAPPSLIQSRAAADASGLWLLNFDASPRPSLQLTLKEQRNGVVTGSLTGGGEWAVPDGLMAGARFADDIRLGRFDGVEAIVLELVLMPTGRRLEGLLWFAGEARPFAFVGERID